MRDLLHAISSAAGPKHRLSRNLIYDKRRHDAAKYHKEINSKSNSRTGRRTLYLKLVTAIFTCGSIMTILQSPTVQQGGHLAIPITRAGQAKVRWAWGAPKLDSGYSSSLKIDWSEISYSLDKLDGARDLRVAVLNFDTEEINQWQLLLPDGITSVIHLNHVSNITWEDLYPEWIDEEEISEVPSCPRFPEPIVDKRSKYNLIAVKLPCRSSPKWARDVARLHLQLTAAKIAASSWDGRKPVYVLIVSRCFPIPNLFKCNDLVVRSGNTWLYKPEMGQLLDKIRLPIGSCKLALPSKATERPYYKVGPREAYATILHSENVYVCGAIAAAQSIRMSGSTRDLIILVDETIGKEHRRGLQAAGWKIRIIKRIRNPKAEPDSYNEWNYSKFLLWQLTDYEKIIFIDADLLILRNIDILFSMPEISATGNNGTLFNSGVMVIEPSNCTFQLLMDHINEIESYNGGDQGYLNEIFSWWHRVPSRMNFLKHFWEGDTEEIKALKTQLFGADPSILFVIHYLGIKPWLCFKDYDCNWNVETQREFASDVAHARWWKVHDKMPKYLQSFCLLTEKQKIATLWDRRLAKAGNFPDSHWRRNISDPRLNICSEESCRKNPTIWQPQIN